MIAQNLTPPVLGKHRDRVRAMMRQDILDAARAIIREQGIKELSMRALGRAVGVTAPTLYDYFPSKDGVLDALFHQGTERLLREFQDAIAKNEPGLPQLRALAAAYRAFAHAEPDLFQLMFSRADPAYSPNDEIKTRSAGLLEILVDAIKHAVAIGHLRPVDPTATALAAWAAVHGFVVLEINGFLRDCVPVEADVMFDTSLNVLFGGFRT
jgi:AcrR family transcriptional regulator